jgi:hypothetical protein
VFRPAPAIFRSEPSCPHPITAGAAPDDEANFLASGLEQTGPKVRRYGGEQH